MAKKSKKMSLYQKSLIIYTLVLLIIAVFALIYVSNSLKGYETGDADMYMDDLTKEITEDAKNGDIDKYITLEKISSPYEKKSSLAKGYEDLFKSADKITYKKVDDYNYDILADGQKVLNVTLKNNGTVHKLGLLVYDDLELEEVTSYFEGGLYEVNIDVADNCTLYINDIEVKDDDIMSSAQIKEYAEVYDKVDLPKLNHYEIKELSYKPDIVVKDEKGKEVEIISKEDTLFAGDFKTYATLEKAGDNIKDGFNPIDFATNWSKFLTAEFEGEPRWGLGRLTPNLIEGTDLYQKAYSWATNVDITFTSPHSLNSITNQKVSNITVYNENAFSAEVYLEKNMTIRTNPPTDKTDVLHDIIYFVYYDGAYRATNITSVTED